LNDVAGQFAGDRVDRLGVNFNETKQVEQGPPLAVEVMTDDDMRSRAPRADGMLPHCGDVGPGWDCYRP